MLNKKKTNRKKETAKVRKPWWFLGLLFSFCIIFTYLYGVWYVPSLPKSEIPPFLQNIPQEDATMGTTHKSDATSVSQPIHPSSNSTASTQTAAAAASEKTDIAMESTVYLRREGVYNILVVGKDAAAHNTDVLLLVSFDTQNGAAAVAQIPRDTYCNGGKINALYAKYLAAAKRNGDPDTSTSAMESLCETISLSLAVRIDHWVLCDLSAFRSLVDEIGGVRVAVPCDMQYEDPAQALIIDLKKGEQILNGTQAEQFVRFRSGYVRGDLGRIDMQKLFLSALLAQMKSSVSLLDVPSLASIIQKNVTTSLTFSDVLFFLRGVQKLSTAQLTLFTFPGTDCRADGNSGAWYYILSRKASWELVNRYLNVYQTPIREDLFDSAYRLTDTQKPSLLSYYHTYVASSAMHAQQIIENGIDVAVIDP